MILARNKEHTQSDWGKLNKENKYKDVGRVEGNLQGIVKPGEQVHKTSIAVTPFTPGEGVVLRVS